MWVTLHSHCVSWHLCASLNWGSKTSGLFHYEPNDVERNKRIQVTHLDKTWNSGASLQLGEVQKHLLLLQAASQIDMWEFQLEATIMRMPFSWSSIRKYPRNVQIKPGEGTLQDQPQWDLHPKCMVPAVPLRYFIPIRKQFAQIFCEELEEMEGIWTSKVQKAILGLEVSYREV